MSDAQKFHKIYAAICVIILLYVTVAESQAVFKGDMISLRGTTIPSSCWPGQIRKSSSDSKLYICNPSAVFEVMGAGGAGSAGINMLAEYNYNAEDGSATDWSESGGGTLTVTSTTANVGNGSYSFSFDASANNDYAASTAVTIPSGLQSQNCMLKFRYKGFDSNITAQVHDGTNVVATQALVASTNWSSPVTMNFVCPSSGTLQMRLLASADAAIGYWDEVQLGEATNVGSISQATLLGAAFWPNAASCQWSTTGTGTPANLSADSDCTLPSGSQLAGNALAPATKVPGIRFSQVPPGELLFIVTADIRNTASDTCRVRISDGTNSTAINFIVSSASYGGANWVGRLRNTTAKGDTTYQIQISTTSGGACNFFNASAPSDFEISVYHYPLESQQAITTNTWPWRVDANISGANPDLGTADQTAYVGIENSGLTLTNNSGTGVLTAQIPCSSTNSPSGTTCSVGNESVGVSFTIPRAGDVRACVSFAHFMLTAASGSACVGFQIVETPANAQTISQEGKSRINSCNSQASMNMTLPHQVCGTFSFSSAGQKTLRLMYEQDLTATVTSNLLLADASSTMGQRDIHWEVYPIDQQMPAPALVGSVTSDVTGGRERIERAYLNCDSASSVIGQSGSWISSIGNISSGTCNVTLTSAWNAATSPTCVAVCNGPSPCSHVLAAQMTSTTNLAISGYNSSGAGANSTSFDANVICMGPR